MAYMELKNFDRDPMSLAIADFKYSGLGDVRTPEQIARGEIAARNWKGSFSGLSDSVSGVIDQVKATAHAHPVAAAVTAFFAGRWALRHWKKR